MSHSMAHMLRKRELGLTSPAAMKKNCQYEKWIGLQDIATDELLYDGHMIMGFTADGRYIMSYQKTVAGFESQYSFHFWRFQLYKKLVKEHSVPLFAANNLNGFVKLKISVHQTDRGLITVVGKGKSTYVSILPPPTQQRSCEACRSRHNHSCLLHSFVFHFNLPNPMGSIPSNLRNEVISPSSDVFVFNTGVSLVAIKVTVKPVSETRQSLTSSPHGEQSNLKCCESTFAQHLSQLDSDKSGSPGHVPPIFCETSSAGLAGYESPSSSNLLSGQVHCYTANPSALASGGRDEIADYHKLSLHACHPNAVHLLCHGNSLPPIEEPSTTQCLHFTQVSQHTLDFEEYIQYTMMQHPSTAERFRGISDYCASVHVMDTVVIGSLAVIVEKWDEEQPELSPFDFDYVPGSSAQRTRTSSVFEGLIVFEWNTAEGSLKTIDVHVSSNKPWLKCSAAKPADLAMMFSCRMHLRSALYLSDLIKVSSAPGPRAISNKEWFQQGKSITHLKHPSLPVYIYLKKPGGDPAEVSGRR